MLNGFTFIGLLFAGAGTLTFATYEIFFIPEFLKTLEIGSSFRTRAKRIFIIYHILFERIRNWIKIKGQLEECNDLLEQNVATLEKALKDKEDETVILWWWY